MPIDEMKQACRLLTTKEEISFAELQNRQGMRHEAITDLPSCYLTILAVETEEALSSEAYLGLLSELKSNHGVRAMQTVFGTAVPEDRQGYRYDLHLSAHLRIEERNT